MKLVVLDDEYLSRLHIADLAKQAGAEVHVGLNGRYIEKNWRKVLRCDAIIIDTQMPFMDGLATIRYLHRKGWSKPVLLIHDRELGPRNTDLVEFCSHYEFTSFGLKCDITITAFIRHQAVIA